MLRLRLRLHMMWVAEERVTVVLNPVPTAPMALHVNIRLPA